MPQAAAYGLILLLLAMFPANIRADRAGLIVAGRRAMPLVWRLPLQLLWILALWWVARWTPPHRRQTRLRLWNTLTSGLSRTRRSERMSR